jgi:hypothetical protein
MAKGHTIPVTHLAYLLRHHHLATVTFLTTPGNTSFVRAALPSGGDGMAVVEHYVKTSSRSHIICNGPLTPVTCTHIRNGCYLAPVTDKHERPTSGLAFATPFTHVYFW